MKKIKPIFKNIYIYIIIMTIIFILLTFNYLNVRAIPLIENYVSFQMKKISIEILRNTGLEEINKLVDKSKLYDIQVDNDGKIESIDFNTIILNDSLKIISTNVQNRLKEIKKGYNLPEEFKESNIIFNKKGNMIYNVPLGVISNNYFFNSLGPKIPVGIDFSSDVSTDIKTNVKEYGVNSALIEAYIYVSVIQKCILPFNSKEIKVTSKIPIIIKIVKGNVSSYITDNN